MIIIVPFYYVLVMKISFVYGIITFSHNIFHWLENWLWLFKSLTFLFFSFISLVPDEIKTSALTGDSGYDTYLRDAHRQVFWNNLWLISRKKCLRKVASFLKHNPDENDLCNPSFFSAANIPYKPVGLTGLNLQCQPVVITKMNKLLLLFTIIIIIMKTTGCNQNLFVCLRCGRQQRGILWRCIFKYVIQKASETFGSGGLKKKQTRFDGMSVSMFTPWRKESLPCPFLFFSHTM